MEPYIQISKINDFVYCPASLYLHTMFEGFSEQTFHATPQVAGKLNHQAVDEKTYSSAKRYLVGMDVYSTTYNVSGKIDMYDIQTKTLIERKTKIRELYDGYRYQLYAQYFCLLDMGYEVTNMTIRSLSDNKSYPIPLPSLQEKNEFESILNQIRSFDPKSLFVHSCPKCEKSIYGTLSW